MEHFESRLLDRFMQVAPFCHMRIPDHPSDDDTTRLLTTGGFEPIRPDPTLTGILTPSRPILTHTMPRGTAAIFRHGGIYYLRFHTPMGDRWLRNTQPAPRPIVTGLWYLLALTVLWGLYFWLVRSLRPLQTLHEAVTRIKDGDLSVSTRQPRRDEIAQVANTLDEALIDSRQLFLHAIMHELKTPIAKGKLLNAFLEEGETRERYEALFDRLDLLLGEFAKIEQMLTAHYTLRLFDYSAVELLDHALELMLIDPDEIDRSLDRHVRHGVTVHTDFPSLPSPSKTSSTTPSPTPPTTTPPSPRPPGRSRTAAPPSPNPSKHGRNPSAPLRVGWDWGSTSSTALWRFWEWEYVMSTTRGSIRLCW